MKVEGAADDAAIRTLVAFALSWTGYRADPSHEAAVRRAVARHHAVGVSAEELVARAAQGEAAVMTSLVRAVSVPETYFFRQPEHFRLIADRVAPKLAGKPIVRAWSAGCATGEEAYSLAACLLAHVEGDVDVLGTDILAFNVERARAGEYGAWSQRASGPLLYPVCGPMDPATKSGQEGRMTVEDRVRAVTRFETHNLLDPSPVGHGVFDLILCRNVLLYFTLEAARVASAHLVDALAPGGIVIFGTLDLVAPPAGLVPIGRPEMSMYMLAPVATVAPHGRHSRPPQSGELRSLVRKKSERPQASLRAAVAIHLSALACIEHGDLALAERKLVEVTLTAPDYLPGLFELALLHVRRGDAARGGSHMRDVIRRLDALAGDALVEGPEDLPAEYYRVAARAYLESADVVGELEPKSRAKRLSVGRTRARER